MTTTTKEPEQVKYIDIMMGKMLMHLMVVFRTGSTLLVD